MVRESESTSGSAGITHQSDLWQGLEVHMINLGPNESSSNSGWGDCLGVGQDTTHSRSLYPPMNAKVSGLEKSALQLSGTVGFSSWTSNFSFSLARWARN